MCVCKISQETETDATTAAATIRILIKTRSSADQVDDLASVLILNLSCSSVSTSQTLNVETHIMWTGTEIFIILLISLTGNVYALQCSRYPPNTIAPKSPVDENFVLSITSNAQNYILGQTYNSKWNWKCKCK